MTARAQSLHPTGCAGAAGVCEPPPLSFAKPLSARPSISPASTSRTPSPGLRLEVLRNEEGLERLAAHWDRLLDQSAVRTPFMRWDWAEIWWKHFAADHSAVFAAAWTADGTLAALVPLVIGPGHTAARRHLRHLSYFAGLGEVVAEGLDCMARPGHEKTVPQLLDLALEECRGEWDSARFGFLDDASPFRACLEQALQRHATAVTSGNPQSSPVASFGADGWEGYLKQRSSNFRKKLRRIQRAAVETRRVTFREVRDRTPSSKCSCNCTRSAGRRGRVFFSTRDRAPSTRSWRGAGAPVAGRCCC